MTLMQAGPTAQSAGWHRERWGYCPGCETWLLSTRWPEGAHPPCPRCGVAAETVEVPQDGKLVLHVLLEVPARAHEPAF